MPRRVAYECNQYFLRFAHRDLHATAGSLDAQAETEDYRVSIAKDVSILRLDHLSIEGKLLGMWQTLHSGGVLDFKEMSRGFAHIPPELFRLSTYDVKTSKLL